MAIFRCLICYDCIAAFSVARSEEETGVVVEKILEIRQDENFHVICALVAGALGDVAMITNV